LYKKENLQRHVLAFGVFTGMRSLAISNTVSS
jgi:hypothetical protein